MLAMLLCLCVSGGTSLLSPELGPRGCEAAEAVQPQGLLNAGVTVWAARSPLKRCQEMTVWPTVEAGAHTAPMGVQEH